MNLNEYNVLKELYVHERVFFRNLSKKSGVSIGGTQQVLKDYANFIKKRKEGRNTYYSLDKDSFYLKVIIEVFKTQLFLKKNKLFKEFFDYLIEENIPAVVFGSYAKGNNSKSSDLDILILSKKKISDHLCPVDMHIVKMDFNDFEKADKEALLTEIKKNHVFVNYFDYFVKRFEDG